jgi:hypothetical protein
MDRKYVVWLLEGGSSEANANKYPKRVGYKRVSRWAVKIGRDS